MEFTTLFNFVDARIPYYSAHTPWAYLGKILTRFFPETNKRMNEMELFENVENK